MPRHQGSKGPCISIKGERVLEIRTELELSQQKLSEQTGLSKGYLSMIENNRRPGISRVAARALADGLRVDINELINDHESDRLLVSAQRPNILKFSGKNFNTATAEDLLREIIAAGKYLSRISEELQKKS